MLLLWGAALAANDCSAVPPTTGWVVAIGYGDGPRVQALKEAREDAQQRLAGQLCTGWTDLRCAEIARNVRDWTEGEWRGRTKGVCAVAAIQSSWLDAARPEMEAFRDGLDRLVQDAARKAGGPFTVGTVAWAGAGTPGVDAVVAGELQNALARANLLTGGTPTLSLTLAAAGQDVVVSAALDGLAGGRAPLEGLRVAGDLVGASEGLAPSGPVPASGTVYVNGAARTEVHWVDGCAGTLTAVGSPPSDAARVDAWRTWRARSLELCQQYERFVVGAEDYGRRRAELDAAWAAAGAKTTTAMPARAAADARVHLEARMTREGGAALRSGDVVHQGDRFLVQAEADQPVHLYVVYENSAGERAVFPQSREGVVAAAGEERRLPTAGFIFQVDAHAGRAEIVRVVAAVDPVDLSGGGAAVLGEARRGVDIVPETVFSADGSAWYGDTLQDGYGYGTVVVSLVLDHQ